MQNFDPEWYIRQYPDVHDIGMDPFEHYSRFGRRMGRSPGPHAEVARSTPRFSVIMPTKDRVHCISSAIDSLLSQQHNNFELIIVDDGSSDGTEEMVRAKYRSAIDAGSILYIRCEKPHGVCTARNIGLSKAASDWIAYLDSDNEVRPNFLARAAEAIAANPETRTFYANFLVKESGKVKGKPYDGEALRQNNFIDIGVFFHHRECFKKLGGFDTHLARLVDWDLVLRYTKVYPPIHINEVLMDYSDPNTTARISRGESFPKARVQVHRKHAVRDTVSVAILTYNQEAYIEQAIDSALKQKGNFTPEIVISDDGSTDRTPEIIERYAKKHPNLIRVVGSHHNFGISENFKRCFAAAAGEFIAVLEGDDYWNDERNLAEKIAFMRSHADSPMVFSRLQILKGNGRMETLERQTKLGKTKVTGQDFLNEPNMNLIVNFSSCLFKTDLMKSLPYHIYHYRLSEIALAFWLERFGPLGYIDKPLTVYRSHDGGAWSGLDTAAKLRSQLAVREIARDVARPTYREQIERIIETKFRPRLQQLTA